MLLVKGKGVKRFYLVVLEKNPCAYAFLSLLIEVHCRLTEGAGWYLCDSSSRGVN